MIQHCKGYEVIRLPEWLDFKKTSELHAHFAALAREGRFCHVIDMNGADPHSIKAISAMIVILRSVRERGGDVRLVAPNHHARRMLGVTGLDKVFRVFETVDSAQAVV